MLQTGSLTMVLPAFSGFVLSEFMVPLGLSGRAGRRVLSVRYRCVAPDCRRQSAEPQWHSAANGLSSGSAPPHATIHGWRTSVPARLGSNVPLPPFSGRRGPGLRRGAGAAANSLGKRPREARHDGFLCVQFSLAYVPILLLYPLGVCQSN